MIDPASLYASPNALADDYSRFDVGSRLLLTGHSHQAWPDVAFGGQVTAFDDAARHADDKWSRAFAMADAVREGYRVLLGDSGAEIALAASTHDLIVRLLSALPLAKRPRLITTDGEFHTLRRQLDRLAETSIEVVKVAARPVDTLAERLAAEATGETTAVFVSSVLFRDARIVPGLEVTMAACARHGAELVVDLYHQLNAVPFSVERAGLEGAFLIGGGYKYCQLGEGNAFMRIPPGRAFRPLVTGWYSEFETLAESEPGERVRYGKGAARFAGATYDPTSHYRAAAVFDFFGARGLNADLLREVSRHQMDVLREAFDAHDLDRGIVDRDRAVDDEEVGGFLALTSHSAGAIRRGLAARGVQVDHRDGVLRLGPAPYLSDRQLTDAVVALAETVEDAADRSINPT